MGRTAEQLLLVIEVVTTTDRRKELKDTRFQRLLNEYNNVPEFVLVFPELDDARALTFCRLVDGNYHASDIAPGGRVESQALPGLVFEVRPHDAWELGRKLTPTTTASFASRSIRISGLPKIVTCFLARVMAV